MTQRYTCSVLYKGEHIGWMDQAEPEVYVVSPHIPEQALPAWKFRAGVREYIFHDEPVQMAVKALKWERLEKR